MHLSTTAQVIWLITALAYELTSALACTLASAALYCALPKYATRIEFTALLFQDEYQGSYFFLQVKACYSGSYSSEPLLMGGCDFHLHSGAVQPG